MVFDPISFHFPSLRTEEAEERTTHLKSAQHKRTKERKRQAWRPCERTRLRILNAGGPSVLLVFCEIISTTPSFLEILDL